MLFIIPWERYWIISTTDTPYHQDFTHPVASAADIDYVLDHANVVLSRPLTRADVVGTFAGLRPLLQPATKGDGTQSTKVSREHTVTEAAPGLVTIAGGKLTTYRVMAEDAVDFALGEAEANAVLRTPEPLPCWVRPATGRCRRRPTRWGPSSAGTAAGCGTCSTATAARSTP